MRIDSSGRLLLGTTTEGEPNADNLTIADTENCGLTLRSGSSNYSCYFSDATSGNGEFDGYIDYNQSTSLMRFGTASTTRVVIDSSGRLLVGTSSNFDADANIKTQGRRFGLKRNVNTNGFSNGLIRFYSGEGLTSQIFGLNDGTQATGDTPGALVFSTSADGTSAPTQRMRIDELWAVVVRTDFYSWQSKRCRYCRIW